MKPFKFFQNKPERVFTDYMDQMDDYFLGGIRPARPIDETYPEYYNCDGFVFENVSETRYDNIDGRPYKVMLFRSVEEGNTIQGNRIHPGHPMWNFPDII